ncbi:HD-GYP domain-containing protein [Lutispora saccharofermentans]|uniref:HD-GYP domain-containing protein n=1 Tax=Lutispora saccharofermentans TaxID=3024236 RepID=A0ABT1NJ91_9FIRM|nr:HD-GYP domain-containing protein [Lutispora saccharofermentans]
MSNDNDFDLFDSNIDDLLKLLKFDSNTYKHSMNVAQYSKKFTELLGDEVNINTIYYSGLFHDIGKIKVDSSILNKKSELKPEEFSSMMKHSQFGYNILKQTHMPKEMKFAAFFHHERWDGKGYPWHLEAGQIPKVARLISICDVFDALTSDRPYRKAYSIEKALNIMQNSKGQFDQELFKAFIDNLDSIIDK